MVEMLEMPAGDTPPVRVNHDADEGVYVLSGEVRILMAGREVCLTDGAYQLAPRGVPHAYRVGDAPAQVMILSYRDGFERFADAVADLSEVDAALLVAAA